MSLIAQLAISLIGDNRELKKAFDNTEKQFNRLEKKMYQTARTMGDVGKSMTALITAPLVAMGTVAAKSAIDFESAFAGVRKTVDATEQEFAELSKGIRNMAKEIPATAVEIAGVAEAAGQLGIANEHILSFTRTMIDLGESTNMSAETAATNLARLANITQMSQADFDRLGSTIVALGNSLATTEAEIVEMGLRLAGAGKQVGMTEAEILSLAGALSSVGIAAEAGGSALSKVMINMQLAVETGGKELDNFARVAGMSAESFRKAFQEDAAQALIAFITGLQRAEEQGTSAIKVLDDIGISEVRMRDALLRAAGAGDLFAESIALGTQAWEENIALTKEAKQRYQTTASQIQIMKNNITDIAISFGELMLPILNDAIEYIKGLTQRLSEMDPQMKNTIIRVSALAVVFGPVLTAFSKFILNLKGLLPLLKSFKLAMTAINGPTLAIGAAIGGLIALVIELGRNWRETGNLIISIWNTLAASVKFLVVEIQLAFEHIKHAVLSAVNFIVDKLSVLEKLPFGIGEKFAAMKDSIADSTEASAEKIEELRQRAKEAGNNIKDAASGVGQSFKELGGAIVSDVKGMVGSIVNFVTGTETAMAAANESIDDATESFENLGIAINETGINISSFNYELGDTVKTSSAVTEILSEMENKLQQLNDEYVVFGDEIDINSRKARIYRDAIIELVKELGPNHEKVQELLAVYNELAKSEEKVTKATFDLNSVLEEHNKKIALVDKRAKVFGDEVQVNTEKVNILKNTIETLIENGITENNEELRKLIEQYREYRKEIVKAGESTFDLQATLNQMEKALSDVDTRAKIFGDEINASDEKAKILKNTIISLIDNGFNPQDEILKTLIKRYKDLGKAADDTYQKRRQFEQDWNQKLFELTASRIELLEQEKKQAIQRAKDLGANKAAIIAYYERKITEIENEEAQKRHNTLQNNLSVYQNAMAGAFANIIKGTKSVTDAFRAFWEDVIDQVIKKLAELAASKVFQFVISGLTGGGGGLLGGILGGIGKIFGFAKGALVTGPVAAVVGEGMHDEVVMPLNRKVFANLAQGIVSQLSQMQLMPAVAVTAGQTGALERVYNTRDNREITIAFNIGNYMGDELSRKQLVRDIRPILEKELERIGGR